MSKMSKLWYEARDAIDNDKYLKASIHTLRKYLAELSIVQPWESDPKCSGAVDKKNGMKKKLQKEIERRNQKFWADVREYTFYLSIAVVGGLIVLFAWQQIENKPDAKNQTKKSQPSSTQEAKTTQLPAVSNYSASRRLPPKEKVN